MTGVFHTGAVFDFQEPSRRVVPEGSPAPAVAVIPPPHSVRVWNRWQRRIRGSGNSAGCLPGERRFRTSFVVRYQSFAAEGVGGPAASEKAAKAAYLQDSAGGPDAKLSGIVAGILPFWKREQQNSRCLN